MKNYILIVATFFCMQLKQAEAQTFEESMKKTMGTAIDRHLESLVSKIQCFDKEVLKWRPSAQSKTIEEEVIQLMNMTMSLKARITGEKMPEWNEGEYLSRLPEYQSFLKGIGSSNKVKLSELPPDGNQPTQANLVLFLLSRLYKVSGLLEGYLAIKGISCDK